MTTETGIIAAMMRRMSDEELAKIATNHFTKEKIPRPVPDGTRSHKTIQAVAAPKKTPKGGTRAPRVTKEQQHAIVEKVFAVVKEHPGLASSEIGKRSGIDGSRLTTALRNLRSDQRIYQGGKLRFARYATTQKAAEAAAAQAAKKEK